MKIKNLIIIQAIFVFLILNLNFISSGDPIISDWADSNFVNEEEQYICYSELKLPLIGSVGYFDLGPLWVIIENERRVIELVTEELGNCVMYDSSRRKYKTCCKIGENCEKNDDGKYVCVPYKETCRDYSDKESCEFIITNSQVTIDTLLDSECGTDIPVDSHTIEECSQKVLCDCYWDEQNGKCEGKTTYTEPTGSSCDPNSWGYECEEITSEVDDQCETTGNYNINLIKTLRRTDTNKIVTDSALKKQYECEDINKPYPCSSLTRLSFYSVAQLVITFLIIFILYFLVVERKNTLRKANSQGKSNIDSKTQKKSRNKKNLKKSKKFSKK